jgi:hypothetical protein
MTKIGMDVDGVLNRMDRSSIVPPWRLHQIPTHIGTLNVALSDDWGKILLSMAEQAEATLFWHTFWEDEANTEIAPLIGLPELEVAPMVPQHFSDRNSVSAIKGYSGYRWLADNYPGEPFILVDDDIGMESYLDMHMRHSAVPYAFILVDEMEGLSEANIRDIIRYGKEFAQWRSET